MNDHLGFLTRALGLLLAIASAAFNAASAPESGEELDALFGPAARSDAAPARADQYEPDTGALERAISQAEKVRDNVMDTIKAGSITPSTKAELERTEKAAEGRDLELESVRRHRPAPVLRRARIVAKLRRQAERRSGDSRSP